MNLVDRAKNMIVTPKTEWDVVAAEEPNTQQILVSYVLPLALIPAIATTIGWGVIGTWGFTSFTYGIALGLVQLFNSLISVLVASFVIDLLAPSFGSTKNFGKAVQLVAFSMTPMWVFGILNIVPAIGWLAGLAGLYGLYILYLGFSPIMKTPEDKKVVYMIISIVVIVVVYWVIAMILTAILLSVFGLSLLGALGSYQ